MDVGRWLAKNHQHAAWQGLMDGQRELLEAIGVTPLAPEREAPAKASKAASGAFERALRPWRSTGSVRALSGLSAALTSSGSWSTARSTRSS
jgi:hypothetical protein